MESYDDHTKQCYNICNNGHSSCLQCYNQLILNSNLCPICKTRVRAQPLLTRINNEELPQINLSSLPIVLLADVSGSMNEKSGDSNSPKRIELLGHMMKIMLRFSKELNKECIMYTFNSSVKKLFSNNDNNEKILYEHIESLVSSSATNLGLALENVYNIYKNNAMYFVFTDGQSSDHTEKAVKLFDDAQLHLLSFSQDVNTKLLMEVSSAGNKHTISYIQDINSLLGYMIPIFIYANTIKNDGSSYNKELTALDEELRKSYVDILYPQLNGTNNIYKLQDLINVVNKYKNNSLTSYPTDLEIDTNENKLHGRIYYSIKDNDKWQNFGKFYLKCIYHCHKYKIPGNAFDASIQHYKTDEYQKIYKMLVGKAEDIPFVSFTENIYERELKSKQANVKVQKTLVLAESYSTASSWCNDNDGCISGESLILMKKKKEKGNENMCENEKGNICENGNMCESGDTYKDEDTCESEKKNMHEEESIYNTVEMRNLKIGDETSTGIVKWIIKISNLNYENEFPMYNGLTRKHPICEDDVWKYAENSNKNMTISNNIDVVYDIVLSDPNVSHIVVNGTKTAVVGYPIPGMIHPYWGNEKVLIDLEQHCPGGGIVEVDAKNFKRENGHVNSIF